MVENCVSGVMLRRINFYTICFAFGISVLLILAGSRYTDNTNYHPSYENSRNGRNLKVEDEDSLYPQALPTNPADGSLAIDKLFDNTRTKIISELIDYNFTHSGVNQLQDLLMEEGGQPLRSLIVSTWRSGTTFLGEILNAVPGNFYHYEPLLSYDIIQIRGPPHEDNALKRLMNMLKCDFQDMDDYFKYGKSHPWQFSHNNRLWDHCKNKKQLCYEPELTGKFCKLFPFQSMKIVRVRLRLIHKILENKDLNVKVLLLIRDPRGVMQSRQHRDFCQPSPDCGQPELLCADMISDYVAAARLLKRYPNRVMVQRYEELALNPNSTTHKIFKFFNLSITPSIDKFLNSHTNKEISGVSVTYRVSRDVPFKWKNALNYTDVYDIQVACKEAMDLWGYRLAHNASHLTSKTFNPLDDYIIKE